MIGILLCIFIKTPSAASSLEQVIEGAKKEGKIVFYESQPLKDWTKIMEGFQKRYPFIKKWGHERMLGAEGVNRVLSESQAKVVTADMVATGPLEMRPVIQRGLFRDFDWKAMGISQKTIFDNHQVILNSFITVICYNTQLVSTKDAPKTWEDLLDPKWKGKVAAAYRIETTAGLAAKWGQNRAEEYLKRFLANDFVQMQSTTAVTSWIASGQSPVGVGSYNLFEKAKQEGAPLNSVLAEPVVVTPIVGAIPKGGENPNAAKLLIHWLTSSEGAKIYEHHTGRGNPFIQGTEYEKLIGKLDIASWPADRFDEYMKVAKALGAILRR